MNEELFEKIFSEHKETIKYFDVPNSTKLVIAFSGVPGSGKTTLAKILEEKFKGIRINNDLIRNIIRKEAEITELIQIQKLLVEYAKFMRPRLVKSLNKLIILDWNINRSYDLISNYYESRGYKLFIIKMDISKEVIVKRIKERNSENPDPFLERLDEWIKDSVSFASKRNADFIIKEDNEEERTELINTLDKLI